MANGLYGVESAASQRGVDRLNRLSESKTGVPGTVTYDPNKAPLQPKFVTGYEGSVGGGGGSTHSLLDAPDLGFIGAQTAFGEDRPGEQRLYEAMLGPLARAGGINLDLAQQMFQRTYGGAPGSQEQAYLGGVLPGLQTAFGMTPEQRAETLSLYQQSADPLRQTQQQQLAGQAAAMGLGGGRTARALAQQQRGFGEQDLQLMQQLVGADITGRQQAAQVGAGLYGQQSGQQAALLQQALQSLTGIGQETARAPLYAMEAFKSTA